MSKTIVYEINYNVLKQAYLKLKLNKMFEFYIT